MPRGARRRLVRWKRLLGGCIGRSRSIAVSRRGGEVGEASEAGTSGRSTRAVGLKWKARPTGCWQDAWEDEHTCERNPRSMNE